MRASSTATSDDLVDVESNICHGARVFGRYLKRTGNVKRALLRYNGCVVSANTPNCHRYPAKVFRAARTGAAGSLPLREHDRERLEQISLVRTPRARAPAAPSAPVPPFVQVLQSIDQRRRMLVADAGRLRARAKPLALRDRTPLVGEIAVEGVDRPAHHAGGRGPRVGLALAPTVEVERRPGGRGEPSA